MEITEISGYRVLRPLGAGAMGQVFLVQHPRLPRQDALKLLDAGVSRNDDFTGRFHREADLLAQLSHPNIVTLYDRGEFDGRLWIAMEFVDGTDAAELLRTRGALPVELAQQLIAGAGAALDYAWRKQQITHRDVKPANILVAIDDGQIDAVKLADFGIAKAAGEATSLTATGITVGTMQYISPEAIEGADVDNRSDVYSLGCTAFHLLTGQPPFAGKTMTSLISAHLHHDPPSITDVAPGLPAELESVFTTVLAKNPDDRYQSCGEFIAALTDATGTRVADPVYAQTLTSIPVRPAEYDDTMVRETPPPTEPPHPPTQRRTSRGVMAVLWTSLAVIALAAIAAAFILTRDGGSGTATPPITSTITSTTTVSSPTSSETPTTTEPTPEPTTAVTVTEEPAVPQPVEGMPCTPGVDQDSPDGTLSCSGLNGVWTDYSYMAHPPVQWDAPCSEPGARARVQGTDAVVTCKPDPSGNGYMWQL